MKKVFFFIIIIFCMPIMVNAEPTKPPTCKEQIAFLRDTIKVLEETIKECKKEWDGTCNMAISANHEAVLDGFDYAVQICPTKWKKKLKEIERNFNNVK